jgi:flagellar hook-associated protein 2
MAVTTDYVTALGAGSGLDTKAIVKVMVDAEKASKQSSIDRNTLDVTSKISSMGQVKSALTNLQAAFAKLDDKDDFNFSALSNSDSKTVYAQFDGTKALSGTFSVTVSQLAQSEIRQSDAQASASADLHSGVAYSFDIQTGSGTTNTVSLAAGDVSLDKMAEAINDLKAGYTAWVVETSAGSHQLLLQGPSGSANNITITDSADLFGLNAVHNKAQVAQNAEGTMNGVSVSRSSNVISDLVPGVAMEFSTVSITPVTLSVTRDATAASNAITNVVTAYNEFEAILKDETATKNELGEAGALKSDSAIRGVRDVMRRFMSGDSSTPGSSITSMSDIGIQLQRSGEYTVDATKLTQAIQTNYDQITTMFSADTNSESPYGVKNRGIAGDLVTQIRDYLSSTGIVKSREESYTNTQAQLETDQTALDKKMEGIEARYTRQFATMNRIMDEMKTMQSYLETQLENLPYTSKNN